MRQDRSYTSNAGSQFAAGLRLLGFFGLIAMMIPIQLLHRAWKPEQPFRIPQLFHHCLLWLLGFRLHVQGAPDTAGPVLFVANHSSYLDIPVLGSLIPAAFVAKEEVAHWPLLGWLAKLQKTVFIERKAARTQENGDDLRARLASGQSLILFPEGTSTDGRSVLPFKSGLFEIALEKLPEGRPVVVQPVSITCTGLDGLPITRSFRPYYAWFGDMTLAGHLWNVFKFGRFTVDVIFHTAVTPENFANRKTLAQYCHDQVAQGIEQLLSGRALTPKPNTPQLPAPNAEKLLAGETQ